LPGDGLDEERPDRELDEDRDVAVLDAQLTLHAAGDHDRRLARPRLALGGDEEHVERRRHAQAPTPASCFACASASSIPPTMKNACSGRWSYSPSARALNEAMVSSIGVYFPAIPVNCWATKNGCDRNFSILRARPTITLSSSDSSSTPRIAMMSCRSL